MKPNYSMYHNPGVPWKWFNHHHKSVKVPNPVVQQMAQDKRDRKNAKRLREVWR